MGAYKDRLDEGYNDAKVIDGCCSICGEQLDNDPSMAGYYTRRAHFKTHGLTTEQARYSALKIIGEPIDKSSMDAFFGEWKAG